MGVEMAVSEKHCVGPDVTIEPIAFKDKWDPANPQSPKIDRKKRKPPVEVDIQSETNSSNDFSL